MRIPKLEFGKWHLILDFGDDFRWIQLFNYLPDDRYSNGRRLRYFGYRPNGYDGISSMGFWFFNVAWQLG